MARPVGVTVIAILSLFVSFVIFCLIASVPVLLRHVGLDIGIGVDTPGPHPIITYIFGNSLYAPLGFVVVLALTVAAIFLINGVGLLRLRNWARWMTIVLACLQLAHAFRMGFASLVFRDVVGLVFHAAMTVFLLWVLVYMFRPHVKQAFRAGVAAQ